MNFNDDSLQSRKRLKWFLSRIENFNNAVPYQINALNVFKNNIKKQYRLGNFTAVRHERISAERIIRNMKQMLIDIERLKEQVEDCDHERFNKLVAVSVECIMSSLNSFNDYYESLPLGSDQVKQCNNNAINEVIEMNKSDDDSHQKQILLHMQEDAWKLQNQIEIANAVQKIEQDSQIVNEIFHDLAKIINDQRETVNKIEDHVEISHEQVVAAEKQLVQVAAKLKGGIYPLVGALLGSCIGGPIGFLAGFKVGTVVAVGGTVIGFSGGKVLKMKQQRTQQRILKSIEEKSSTEQSAN